MAVLVGAAAILPVLGMAPHLTMDRLADLGQGFFQGVGHAHAIHFFSFVNLKGGLISIGIGAVLYLAVIRQFLMKPGKAGGRDYANMWPVWLDLENLVYRPVIEKALPGICGAVCRSFDHMVDGLVVLARKTVCRQLPEPKTYLEGNWLGHVLGAFVDNWLLLWDGLTGKRKKGDPRGSAVSRFIDRERRIKHM